MRGEWYHRSGNSPVGDLDLVIEQFQRSGAKISAEFQLNFQNLKIQTTIPNKIVMLHSSAPEMFHDDNCLIVYASIVL